MEFEWDMIQAKLNIEKHGVSFEEAIDALKDEFGLESFDDLHSEFEEFRFSLIGLSRNGVLYVIYTMLDTKGVYHIITARQAEKSEEKLYWEARYELKEKKFILEVTEVDYQEARQKGWTEDNMLPIGKHKFRRVSPERFGKKEGGRIKVEFQMKLDLDILKYFEECAESKEIEALQLLLNEKLRALMQAKLNLKKLKINC